MNICDKDLCTGCAACANICPRQSIEMESDDEGFLRPVIDIEKCIKCGSCSRVCPQVKKWQYDEEGKEVYACWSTSKHTREESTSGGAFTELARIVLRKGGYVFGAAFDPIPLVRHIGVCAEDDLLRFRGSKYVQSEIGDCFQEVKCLLQNGKQVLFSGTACQIDGLYHFLDNRFKGQLFTIDLVCHGVPSPRVFKDYIRWLEAKWHSRVESYRFRDKAIGWHLHSSRIRFRNGKTIVQDFFENNFSRGFLSNIFLRPSCSKCIYANLHRPADITLADFWGYQGRAAKDRDDDKGISMVMLNTENGQKLFKEALRSLVSYSRSVSEAVKGNPALRGGFAVSKDRVEFWQTYNSGRNFDDLIEQYMKSELVPDWFRERSCFMFRQRKRIRRIMGRLFRLVFGSNTFGRIKSIKCAVFTTV